MNISMHPAFRPQPEPNVYEQFVVNELKAKCPDLVEEFEDELARVPDGRRTSWGGAVAALQQVCKNHQPPTPHWDEDDDPDIWDKRLKASRAQDALEVWVRNAPEGRFRNNFPAAVLKGLFNTAWAPHR